MVDDLKPIIKTWTTRPGWYQREYLRVSLLGYRCTQCGWRTSQTSPLIVKHVCATPSEGSGK